MEIENIYSMECKSSNVVYKRSQVQPIPFENIDNLTKKRPSETKLDIEKMYQESMGLSAHYRTLMEENRQLQQEYQRVESIKHNRQNLIAAVEKIVEEKSKEIGGRQGNFSWLVFKLNHKIYDLKAKIEAKEKAISDLVMSKESDSIRQKQTEMECLNEIVSFARDEGLLQSSPAFRDASELSEIKEIVWMEQEIKEKESEIIEAEKGYQQEEKEVRGLMQRLAKKRVQLKSIKEMEAEYHKAQELYREEQRKKEQRIAGNKTYLEDLHNQKLQEQKKLEHLKARYKTMQEEEAKTISHLREELERLRKDHEAHIKIKQETVIKFSEDKPEPNKKQLVKRVTHQQVKLIAGNLNYSLALRQVDHHHIAQYFSNPDQDEYSIKEVRDILLKHPFSMEHEHEALLLARYMIEDAGDGLFLEDMDTAQTASIIRSILGKLVGEVKVYPPEEAERMRRAVGPIVFKFGRLVQQSLEMEDGKNVREINRKALVTKQRMVEALESTISSLQSETFMHEQVQFTIFYLYSYSHDLSALEVRRLFTMAEEEINWPVN